jgi:hypothetical protein
MPVKTQALTGRLAPFRFMESPSWNGIAFNGKPQDFAYACGSPLNENDQCTTQSTPLTCSS